MISQGLYEFVKVERYLSNCPDSEPLEYGYVLKITNQLQVAMLMMADTTPQKVMYDFSESLQKGCHFTEAGVYDLLAQITGKSFVDTLSTTISRKWRNISDLIKEGRTIYMQSCGSYFWKEDDTNELTAETVCYGNSLNDWPDEKEKPRYLKWPNGEHWYIKIGMSDLIIDEVYKYDTLDEAKAAYRKWYNSEGYKCKMK